jgi:8-oxo-dGTP pyrophosphatase MutT (NUDIX family)
MTAAAPYVTARDVVFECPWLRVVAKTVAALPAPYYAVEVPDYTAVCPRTADGRLVLVRQFRPVLETFTWEFPSGQVDPGETPDVSVGRELIEETGYRAARLVPLGAFHADAGRLNNRCHQFFCDAAPVAGWTQQEPEVAVHLVTGEELERMIADGRFSIVQHVALWLQAKAAGLIA